MSSNRVVCYHGHYCGSGSGDPHSPTVRCVDHWLSERQKFLVLGTNTNTNTNTNTTDAKLEENRKKWAQFKSGKVRKSLEKS